MTFFMTRSHITPIICISMLTSNLLFGFTGFVKEHKALIITGSAAALAAGIYGTHKQVRYAVDKRIASLRNYYYEHAKQPITRAQALTATLAGIAGLGVYSGIYTLVQKLKGVHE